MSMVEGLFSSALRDKSITLVNHDTNPQASFAYHDIHSGTFILGINLGDIKGADVYKFDNLDTNKQVALQKLQGNLISSNVTHHLIPWGRSPEMPVLLDSGEPGNLTIVHLPLVRIHLVRTVY